MDRPIRIIHVLKTMHPGGVETWLMNVLRNIDREKFHFTFCTTCKESGTFDEEIRSLGADLLACPLNNGWHRFNKSFISILKEIEPDVVHSHLFFFSGIILRSAAKAGVPVRICHIHSTSNRDRNSIQRYVYRWLMLKFIEKYCTHGIGCSKRAADVGFIKGWEHLGKYCVMPCAINTSAFKLTTDRAKLRKSFGIPPEARIIGHVGSFRRVKNHEFLLRSTASMLSKSKDIHLFLVGDGPLKPQIEELARQLGISEHVTFAGLRNDVPLLMKNLFDLFVLPSQFEGLGLSVVEAQCAGIPSLISDTIPPEATVIDQLVYRQSLDAGPDIWTEQAFNLLKLPRYDKNLARKQVEASIFSLSHSVDFLRKIYSGSEPGCTCGLGKKRR